MAEITEMAEQACVGHFVENKAYKTRSESSHMPEGHVPRLGPPVLDASGRVTFVCEERFVFDKHHTGFDSTSAMPRMLPPVYKDGLIHISFIQ